MAAAADAGAYLLCCFPGGTGVGCEVPLHGGVRQCSILDLWVWQYEQPLVPQVWLYTIPSAAGVSMGNAARLSKEEAGVAAPEEFPIQLPSVSFFHFFFLKNSSCSSLVLHVSAWPLTKPTSPTRLGTIQVRVPLGPILNSPQLATTVSLGAHSPPVCLPLFPCSLLYDFKQPGLSRCCSNLVWQGRELLTQLSPKNPAADPEGPGPGAAATLVPSTGPRDLIVLKHSFYRLIF